MEAPQKLTLAAEHFKFLTFEISSTDWTSQSSLISYFLYSKSKI